MGNKPSIAKNSSSFSSSSSSSSKELTDSNNNNNNLIINPTLANCSLDYYYPIRLTAEQSLALFGVWEIKTTLTWKDVLRYPKINLHLCISCQIDNMKLCRMQPDIKEWIKFGKATIKDFAHMYPWSPNPFTDFNCSIGDLVVHRKYIEPKMLTLCGIDFSTLKDRYGLTKELMVFLKYSLDEWMDLEITQEFVENELPQEHFNLIFGKMPKADILELIRRRNLSLVVNEEMPPKHNNINNNNNNNNELNDDKRKKTTTTTTTTTPAAKILVLSSSDY